MTDTPAGDPLTGSGAPESGDPREAIVQHLPALRAFALSLTRDGGAADDLVQDTIMRAWTRFDQFTPGTNLRSWMLAIMRNLFISGLRKSRSRARAESEEQEGVSLPEHDGHLAMRDFRRAFDGLSVAHREVLTMVGVLGMTQEEAAEALGIATGTVKSRVNRARARLVELLEQEGTARPEEGGPTGEVTRPRRGRAG